MSWMSWLRDRCIDLTERVSAEAGRRPGHRWDNQRQPRGRVPGSGSEPAMTRPASGDITD
ncbi:hypothetical protein G3T14_17880 [Methylobacterium sp. BTF04]|uniref:hypothetical protein n=1 Tax=Methylobacterium sp. BTF04 TaxID=2708300 RepID=UPI0013D04A89|nr:hypothetical protein [Methylobacterium sp. BTF04]NEU13984.1 hypothetical protein [Methylobacterium sp. BTF04]